MTKTSKAISALAGIAIIAAFLIVASQNDTETNYAVEVDQVLESVQSYGGEHVDQLVALGPDAVPAIGHALLHSDARPLQMVSALSRIGDPRATEPLLKFLKSYAPYRGDDGITLPQFAIDALREVNGVLAVPTLREILADVEAHPRIRLAAASALSTLATGSTQRDAQLYILQQYEDRSALIRNTENSIASVDLAEALVYADTEESLRVLIDLTQYQLAPGFTRTLFEYLSTKDRQDVVDALVRVVDSQDTYEVDVRIMAMRSLLALSHGMTREAVEDRAEQLLTEAVEQEWHQTVIDEAKLLRE